MADDIDRAMEQEQKTLEVAISAAQKPEKYLPFTGYCYYCSDPIDMGKRFCDNLCRDDYDYEQSRKVGNINAD